MGVGSSPRSSGIEQCVDQRSEEGLASRHRAGGEIALSTGMLDSDLEQPPAMASTVDEPERKIGETLSEGGEVGSDGRSISSSQKRRSRGQGEVRGRYGGKGEDGEKNIAETGSLFELRDALKAREEELLRLNRDVAAVATSSGGFRLLAAAMAGEDDKGQGPESAVAAVANNATRIGLSVDLRGDNYDDRYMSCYSSSLFDGISRVTGTDDAGASAVGDIFGGDKRGAAEATWSNTRELGVIPSEIGVSQASDGGKQRDAIFSRRAALLPPPIVSGVGAPSNGSPLVASAFEGLRQMRVVLQERELDASIAKDDAKKMVSPTHPPVFCSQLSIDIFSMVMLGRPRILSWDFAQAATLVSLASVWLCCHLPALAHARMATPPSRPLHTEEGKSCCPYQSTRCSIPDRLRYVSTSRRYSGSPAPTVGSSTTSSVPVGCRLSTIESASCRRACAAPSASARHRKIK